MGRRLVRTLKSLKDLIVDEKNANRGTDRGRALIRASLLAYDMGRSVLADRVGRLIAGHKGTEAALAQNRNLRVVQTRGDEVIVVQRVDLDLLTDAKARALAIADNRVAEVDLEWDTQVLQQLQAEGLDLWILD